MASINSIKCSVVQSIKLIITDEYNDNEKEYIVGIGDFINIIFNYNGIRKEIAYGKVTKVYVEGTDPSRWYFIIDKNEEKYRVSPLNIIDIEIIEKKESMQYVETTNDYTNIKAIKILNGSLLYTQDGQEWIPVNDLSSLINRIDNLEFDISDINNNLDGKADLDHNHNDIYYTETEVDTKLDNKADLINGRIPYSQLPESAMEYKGTWNAETNTPILTQGIGTNGDFYLIEGAGIWEGITFNNGDRIIYDGNDNEWKKLSGNTVLSVAGKTGDVTLTKSDITDFPTSMTPTSHNHDDRYYTDAEVDTKLDNKANASHNQSASTITAGTFSGNVVAPTGTDYTTNRVRNIVFTTSDPGNGAAASYANGSILIVYS